MTKYGTDSRLFHICHLEIKIFSEYMDGKTSERDRGGARESNWERNASNTEGTKESCLLIIRKIITLQR